MNNKHVEDKKDLCCQEQDCAGVESCDCQGICICQPIEIDFDDTFQDCDVCCCDEDDDDDEDLD